MDSSTFCDCSANSRVGERISAWVLKNADAEDAGLARTRLRLSNNVSALDDGQNGALLDGGRLFKAYTALVVDWSTQ